MPQHSFQAALSAAHLSDGDTLRLSIGTHRYEGVLLPSSESDSPILLLKLRNGYNVGLAYSPEMKFEKLAEAKKSLGSIPSLPLTDSKNPAISILATGGTIGTHVDYATGGVYMSRTPAEVLSTTPELSNFVRISQIEAPFTMASEDMQPVHWQEMARQAGTLLNDPEVKGLLITHGTDTLHYSSAALSFMLENLGKPVALVGAQKSPDRGSFDGRLNLICGALYAGHSNFAEVAVVMHATSSDDYCYAHRGTKVRKMHTSARPAFHSINDSPLAKIFPDGKIESLHSRHRARSDSPVNVDDRFEPKTALLKVYPGSDPSILDFYSQKGYRGIVLEAMALGHVPTGKSGTDMGDYDYKKVWIPHVKKAVDSGMTLAVTSQALYGRTSPTVYRNLRLLAQTGAVFCSDMLPETAYAKLGCILGRTQDPQQARTMLLQNWSHEFNDRITGEDFQ